MFKIDYCRSINIDLYHWGFFCKRLDEARLQIALKRF